MATLIKSNGTEIEVHPTGKCFSLEELQSFVGGYIEFVAIDKEFYMIVNEEGKLMCLPKNEKATRLYHRVRYTEDVIVGDVLVCNNTEVE